MRALFRVVVRHMWGQWDSCTPGWTAQNLDWRRSQMEEPNARKRLLCCLALAGGEGENTALSQGWLPDSSPGHLCAEWEWSKERIIVHQKGLFWWHRFPGINSSQSRRCLTAQININITENVFLVQMFRYLQKTQLGISAPLSLP